MQMLSKTPEYYIKIKKLIFYNKTTQNEYSGITLTVKEFCNCKYKTVFKQNITPFMQPDALKNTKGVKLNEILQKISAQIKQTISENQENVLKKETQVSRGFCLNIPNLGDCLISHEGDIVLNNMGSNKSVRIIAPSNVVLNDTQASEIQIKANAICLTGKSKATISKLIFKANDTPNDNSVSSLYIDKDSELIITNLTLENSLLFNIGKLTILNSLDLNSGFLFNEGSLITTANQSTFQNITYMLNGSNGKITAQKLVIEADRFANVGSIQANILTLSISNSFNNEGSIKATDQIELNLFGGGTNKGKLESSDHINIYGSDFKHLDGEISAVTLNLQTKESLLSAKTAGQTAFLSGITRITDDIHFQHGIIDGILINSSNKLEFEQLLELSGLKTEIRNKGTISTYKIISNGEKGIIDGGTITAVNIFSKTHLQLNSKMPQLVSIETDENAELLILETAETQLLKKIINKGTINVLSSVPNLNNIQNSTNRYVCIESAEELNNLTTLDDLQGYIDIKASLPKITDIYFQNYISLVICSGSILANLNSIFVSKSSLLVLENNVEASNVKEISNWGELTISTQLLNLNSVYNAPSAVLHFTERAIIKGRETTAEENLYIAQITKQDKNKLYLFNEGTIWVKASPSRLAIPDWYEKKIPDIDICGTYVASKNGTLNLDDGYISGRNICNDGIIYSVKDLKIFISNNPNNCGRVAAETEIIYHSMSPTLNSTIQPIIKKRNKHMKIISYTDIIINFRLSWNVYLDIEAASFKNYSNITVRKLHMKVNNFVNCQKISVQKDINIETRAFHNASGRIQSHGDISITARKNFKNDGGGTIRKNVPEAIDLYEFVNGALNKKEQKIFYRDIYIQNLDKAGVITSGGFLNINTGFFDNSFGILNASKMQIISAGLVKNECGLIYSGGTTYISGQLLQNGYRKGNQAVEDVNPEAPIYKIIKVPYQKTYVYDNYENFGRFSLKTHTVRTCTEFRDENKLVGYEKRIQCTTESAYPGYIFSNDSINLHIMTQVYLGTIVSGNNIFLHGKFQSSIASADRGLLIAKGNINAELQKASLNMIAMQAKNITIEYINQLVIRGIVLPVVLPNGSRIQIINLRKLASQLGFVMNDSLFSKFDTDSTKKSSTGFVPTALSKSGNNDFGTYCSQNAGFFEDKMSKPRLFTSSLQNNILKQLITLTLTPIYGRDILLNINLTGILMENGAKLHGVFKGERNFSFSLDNPAIIFDKSDNPDVEVTINGEKMLLPLYDPYLITNLISKIANKINAEQLIKIKSPEDIQIKPGKINFESKELEIESEKQIKIAADFKLSKTNNRIDIIPVEIQYDDLKIKGKEGVSLQGANISVKKLEIESTEGDVIDKAMPLDPEYDLKDTNNIKMQQKTKTSQISCEKSLKITAINGEINQEGTNIVVGDGGATFNAQKHVLKPAYEQTGFYHSDSNGYSHSLVNQPKSFGIMSSGTVIFQSKDTSLIGGEIVAKSISNPNDGCFEALPAYTTVESEGLTIKDGILGSASRKVEETRNLVNPTTIITDYFESNGAGDCILESAVLHALEASISKNLIERTAYDTISTTITDTNSGFFAPKIKGDPLYESLKGVKNVITFDGDSLPTMFNVIGASSQTLTHALTLANLASNSNPFAALGSIFLSRYVTGFGYSKTKVETDRKEKVPRQSEIKVGVLRVTNDRTHLEGIWNVDQGTIHTGKFTTASPKHTVEQKTKVSGWSVSLSPAALLSAGIGISPVSSAVLPNISVNKCGQNIFSSTPHSMMMNCDDLFIQCDDAIFSGSKIHSRLLEMIVTGNLTIETLTNEFHADAHNAEIGASLASIYAEVNKINSVSDLDNSKLGAVPNMRFANESDLSRKISALAALVGKEKFYLTVGGLLYIKGATIGLKPDGVVIDDDAEKINAKKILEEKIEEAEHHKKHVINPAISEFCSMMSQVDELNYIRAKIRSQQICENASKEEQEKTDKEIQQIADLVKDAEEQADQSLTKSIKKARLFAEEKSKEIKQKTSQMSDEEFALYMSNYATTHDDSIAREFLIQVVIAKFEEQKINKEATDKINSMQFSDKLKEYIGYIVDELTKPSPELAEALLSGDGKFVRKALDRDHMKSVSSVLDLFSPFDLEAVDEHINDEISTTDNAMKQGAAVAETCILGGIIKKFWPSKLFSNICKKMGKITHGVIKRIAEKMFKNNKQFGYSESYYIIKENEMVRRAYNLPGEWNGKFKLIEIITQNNTFKKQVLFKDPKSGEMYRVFQRGDIDPFQVKRIDPKTGLPETNLTAMLNGRAPVNSSGEKIEIHHIGQDDHGPWAEVSQKTHRAFPHKEYGKNKSHPTNPVNRSKFNKMKKNYWKSRGEEFKK